MSNLKRGNFWLPRKTTNPKHGAFYEGGYYIGDFQGYQIVVAPVETQKYLKWDDAIDWCLSLSVNNYYDWRLPSKAVLDFIYRNKLKSHAPWGYWSSTETSDEEAWHQFLTDGSCSTIYKLNYKYARAYRKIKIDALC